MSPARVPCPVCRVPHRTVMAGNPPAYPVMYAHGPWGNRCPGSGRRADVPVGGAGDVTATDSAGPVAWSVEDRAAGWHPEPRWGLPPGWQWSADRDYVFRTGPHGNPQKMLLEHAVYEYLGTRIRRMYIRVYPAVQALLREGGPLPFWRVHPAVGSLLMMGAMKINGTAAVHLGNDGQTLMFGWPLEQDRHCIPAVEGQPHVEFVLAMVER